MAYEPRITTREAKCPRCKSEVIAHDNHSISATTYHPIRGKKMFECRDCETIHESTLDAQGCCRGDYREIAIDEVDELKDAIREALDCSEFQPLCDGCKERLNNLLQRKIAKNR